MKAPCSQILSLAATSDGLFTNAEVFQELLHRYILIGAWERVRSSVVDMMTVFEGRTEPIHGTDVMKAGGMYTGYRGLSARDLIHVAVAQRLGAQYIVSADRGFDAVDEIERLDPLLVDEWRSLVAP